MAKVLVAVCQMTSKENKEDNLNYAKALIEEATAKGVKFLCFPENFMFLGQADGDTKKAAEPIKGRTILSICCLAKKHGLWLSLGGFQEEIPNYDKIHNTHLVINDKGELLSCYRKMHCFTAVLPDGSTYDEKNLVKPGKEVVVVKTPFFTVGLSICYDLRFPRLYTALREKGAEVILIPAAFTEITGKAHWDVLLRARAIETQSYVLAAAQIGSHNEKRKTFGHAMIVDPWGTIIAQCNSTSNLAIAEIDMAYLKAIRNNMPIMEHQHQDYL